MKRNFKNSVLAIALATMTLTPFTSRASIGISSGVKPLAYVGIGAIGAGAVYFAANEKTKFFNFEYVMDFMYSGMIVVLGVVLLDGNNGQEIEFSPLVADQAKELKLSYQEQSAYNAELDMINILLSEANDQLLRMTNPTIEDSVEVWEGLKENISPDAFSAMVKIVNQSNK